MARSVEAIVKDTLNSPEVSEQVSDLQRELGELKTTVSSLLATAPAVIRSRVSEELGAQTESLRAASVETFTAARDRTRDASQATVDSIIAEARRSPIRTLALTLGAGVLLGLWARS